VKLEELGNSIVEHGLLEPLVVRVSTDTGYFEIACGERRWRAMQLKDMQEAEAIILAKECSDDEMEQIALIENIQREDLSPYELALAYDRLHKDDQGRPKRSIVEVARLIQQSKSSVDDHLAILRVPDEVRQLIIDNPDIPLRTIRDLGNVENPDDRLYLADEVRAGNLTSNGLTKILQQSKRTQKDQVSESPSAYADTEGTHSSASTNGASAIPQSTKRRAASPAIALAALEQKLSRDAMVIRKIIDRLTKDATEITSEEKAIVYTNVSQWHDWMQQILNLTKEE
jgi:ParB/RepB/Spo0J family partition protein